jgi:hypothetical protein
MKLCIQPVCIAVAMVLSAGMARADEVRLNDFSILGPSGVNVSVANLTGAAWYGAAGQFDASWNGASFATYCVDLQQYASFGATYSDYTRVDGATAWGAQKADDLAKLITYVGMTPKYSTDSAMVQAAIWEVVYEQGTAYSFTSGQVTASGLDQPTQDWLNALDWNAVRQTVATYDIDALVSPAHQDFVVATPVPEPSTYAMMVGGLALVGFAARRRQPRR